MLFWGAVASGVLCLISDLRHCALWKRDRRSIGVVLMLAVGLIPWVIPLTAVPQMSRVEQWAAESDLNPKGTSIRNALVGKAQGRRCNQEVSTSFPCSWWTLDEQRHVADAPDGELYFVTTRRLSGIQTNGELVRRAHRGESWYVFCSRTRPAVVYIGDVPPWVVQTLAPGHEDALPSHLRYYYPLYYAVCHSTSVEGSTSSVLGRRFGYTIPAARAAIRETRTPRDVLQRGGVK